MTARETKNIFDSSMLDLFRAEVDQHVAILISELPKLSLDSVPEEQIEPLVRAAHSIKGAGRLVGVTDVVGIAQQMEECLSAVRRELMALNEDLIGLLINSVEMVSLLSEKTKEPLYQLTADQQSDYDHLFASWRQALDQNPANVIKEKVDTKPIGKAIGNEAVSDANPIINENKAVSNPVPREVKAGDNQQARSSSLSSENSLAFSSDSSMLELFRLEVEQHGHVITEGLLKLEENPASTESGEALMRAAHSIKGAARLIGLQEAVKLAHMMEDYLVAIREGKNKATTEGIDVLLKSNDMLATLAALTKHPGSQLTPAQREMYDSLVGALDNVLQGKAAGELTIGSTQENDAVIAPESGGGQAGADMPREVGGVAPSMRNSEKVRPGIKAQPDGLETDRVLRISSEQLNRLMGLAGESMVEARWLRPYAESMLQLKRRQAEIITFLDTLREVIDDGGDSEKLKRYLRETQGKAAECRHILAGRLAELESYDRRVVNLSSRLRREVVASRMRPFGDGIKGFARMVRDLARQLGKQAQLHIDGQATMVDRDILDKIEAPLNHLLRNAVDHGIELPEEREKAGKPACGTIRLSTYHHAGMLSIVMEDDGRGVDLERLRRKVVERNLVSQEMANNLGSAELMEFLFLPNFSTRDQVTDISGRGVGLDVVHDVVQEMRGIVRATSQFGLGTRFQLQLPLTLSVLPALLVEIAGEPYAFPLARIERILHVTSDVVREIEGHQYVSVGDHHIGLVSGYQLLGFNESNDPKDYFQVVVLGDRKKSYGLVIDKFLGERDLVVHVLPPRLGKVKDISAAALLEDGRPLLIFDVDDIFRSLEKIITAGRLSRVRSSEQDISQRIVKRILVVDDSITVREVERKLLEASGYQVEIAVDGMDGWNALREGEYDLVITDVDMPRMDGIELVKLIRADTKFQKLPVMIVSYKDREEDRYRGLEAGADYYLTKGSFHDETLREAVVDLIGAAA
jgi:two-component system sensor histidine kinase and response regulator WspE